MALESASSFGRYSQRDERRRRLLGDDLGTIATSSELDDFSADGPPPTRSANYGNAEFLERQMRWLDLVPRRLFVLVPWLAAGAGTIVALELAHAWTIRRVDAGEKVVAAFDAAARGSLASWFSSLVLLAASVAALMIHSVRKHRTDDYQGRYRVWFWAAAGLFLMATDQAAGLREAFRDAMVGWTGVALWSKGELWWVAAYGLLFTAIGSRLLIDVCGCKSSFAAMLAAAAALGMATAVRLGWFMPVEGRVELAMFPPGGEMAGNLLLLSALALYARHVVLDAEGRLPVKTKAKEPVRTDREAAIASSETRWRKFDPPHAQPQPALQRSAPVFSTTAAKPVSQSTAASPPPAPLSRKLTKGEKKALKERLLRERLAREGRG
jgi:hypothetical protein